MTDAQVKIANQLTGKARAQYIAAATKLDSDGLRRLLKAIKAHGK
jgi:hypothetical protein